MPSDQTRSAILAAAERLYAERGFADVTLRDIVAAAGVNLAAVNYHFGSKDELIAELFVTRSIATNRERLNELKLAEQAGGGRAEVEAILRALVGPPLRGCLGRNRDRSPAARFMIRALIESVTPIRARRRTRRGRSHPARIGGTAVARLPRSESRSIAGGAFHDPRLDRVGDADPPHQESRSRSFAEICRRDAPRFARRQGGRPLLGPAFRPRDGAPDHPRQRAIEQIVGRVMRPRRRAGDHRSHRRGVGSSADGSCGGKETQRKQGPEGNCRADGAIARKLR